MDYRGREINYGYPVADGALNSKRSINRASNKRRALEVMREAEVPTPELYDPRQARVMAWEQPLIGRPDRHRAGAGFYKCTGSNAVIRATELGVTHFMEYIEGGREFRVHVAFGKSIKIAEKVGGTGNIRTFKNGWYFGYPEDFHHKKSLRKYAKLALEALELDFGAVDIIWKDGRWYVLEVNTAPSLTSESDILERYVQAFKDNERN